MSSSPATEENTNLPTLSKEHHEQTKAYLDHFLIRSTESPVSELEFLTKSFLYPFSTHVQLVTKTVIQRNAIWIPKSVSIELKVRKRKRDCLLSFCKSYPNDGAAAISLRLLKPRVKKTYLE
jgi:hypothetical protein